MRVLCSLHSNAKMLVFYTFMLKSLTQIVDGFLFLIVDSSSVFEYEYFVSFLDLLENSPLSFHGHLRKQVKQFATVIV